MVYFLLTEGLIRGKLKSMNNVKKVQIDPDQLREMRSQNLSITKMCEILGTARSTTIARMKDIGLLKPQSKAIKVLDEEDVRRAYLEENKSFTEMAKQFKCSKTGLRRLVVRMGIHKPDLTVRKEWKKFKLTKEELREMHVDKKMADKDIARQIGVGVATVYKWRVRWDIYREMHFRRVDLPQEEIRRMYIDEKMRMLDIAKHFDCKISLVRANLIRCGIVLEQREHNYRKSERNKLKRGEGPFPQKDGYVQYWMPDHPTSTQAGYMVQHRRVVEIAIGRDLVTGEKVHHIGIDDRADNRLENLALMPSNSVHSMIHGYMGKVGAYLAGLTPNRTPPFKFKEPTFWAGRWVTEIDLIADKEAKEREAEKQLHDLFGCQHRDSVDCRVCGAEAVAALADFKRTMEEETIPAIVEAVDRRNELANESREWLVQQEVLA
jgi:transposase